MPLPKLLNLVSMLWVISTVLAYTHPFEYRAASPLIARDKAPFLQSLEPVLERRDYCGNMYCTCPNECIDDDTCTTNAALLPCPVDGGSGASCKTGYQVCPDGTGCCGIDEICDDNMNTCLGCDAGFARCGDHCCEPGTTCVADGCQGSSSLSSAGSTTKPSVSVTSLPSASGSGVASLGASVSTAGSSSGVPASTPSGSANNLGGSLEKSLAFVGVGWIIVLF